MKLSHPLVLGALIILGVLHISQGRAKAQTLQEQNDVLFEKLKSVDGLQDE